MLQNIHCARTFIMFSSSVSAILNFLCSVGDTLVEYPKQLKQFPMFYEEEADQQKLGFDSTFLVQFLLHF